MANIINPNRVSLKKVEIVGPGKIILGKNCQIRPYTVIEFGNGTLIIGENSVIGYSSFLQVTGKIEIGNSSLLGPHCCFISSTHKIEKDRPISKSPLIRGEINIKNNVWIGANCTINYNVTINNNSIIGANSFVNKNIPTNQVWAGSPAKFIKDNK